MSTIKAFIEYLKTLPPNGVVRVAIQQEAAKAVYDDSTIHSVTDYAQKRCRIFPQKSESITGRLNIWRLKLKPKVAKFN